MKRNKQARVVLLAMLAAISILPACGKKSDNVAGPDAGPAPIYAPVGPVAPVAPAAGCISLAYNGGVTITFHGSLNSSSIGVGSTGVSGQLTAYSTSYAVPGFASNFTRTNIAGETLNLYVNGNDAYATVSLPTQSVNAIRGMGYSSICGLSINAAYISSYSGAGWTGTLGGGLITMWSNNGQYIRFSNGQYFTL